MSNTKIPKGEALTFDQMQTYLSGFNSKILMYDDLPEYNSLKEIFNERDFPFTVVFHKNETKDVGHFCVLIQETDEMYSYYDPSGKHGPDDINKVMNTTPELQTRMFFKDITTKTGEKLYSIKEAHQTKTSLNCGRFCLFRINCIKMKTPDYYEMMNAIKENVMDLEKFIVSVTAIPTIARE